MKHLKSLLALFAIIIFTACHNPNSSTSQEIEDESTMQTNEHEGNTNMNHEETMEHGAMEKTDTTHQSTMPAMHSDSTDSIK